MRLIFFFLSSAEITGSSSSILAVISCFRKETDIFSEHEIILLTQNFFVQIKFLFKQQMRRKFPSNEAYFYFPKAPFFFFFATQTSDFNEFSTKI